MYILTSEEARKNIEPRKLANLKIIPSDVTIEPKKSYSFIAKGYDQHEDEINIDSIDWKTSSGSISEAGVLTVEETEGTYKITAKSNGITASATATVKKKDDTKTQPLVIPPSPGKTKISWSGQIDKKKWNVFYTKVLAKFASNPNLTITIKFEVEEESAGGEQKKEETKTALKELGLEDNI